MFMLPAESAHNIAMAVMRRGLVRARKFHDPILEQELFGVRFPNPIGLAAGFDKNALAVPQWHRLGFGYAEIGTITWHPQPGNPKPRLFRLPKQRALINRFGFNNDGAKVIASRLGSYVSSSFSAGRDSQCRSLLARENVADPAEGKSKIGKEGVGGGATGNRGLPIGINLGKSKITELRDAASDYQESFRTLHQSGDYFVVNVSSPNTPGLRSLQERGPLLEILQAMKEVNSEKPLFFKVAPDLEFDALDDLIQVAYESKATGIIATNTTLSRDAIPVGTPNRDEVGGLSGAPLKTRSDQVLRHLAKACGNDMVLIGVGGISNSQDVFDKLALGAHLTQVYSGWVYGGPNFVPELLSGLVELLQTRGIKSLDEIRGSAN